MSSQVAKSLIKEFRASFRRKKVVVDPTPKVNIAKEATDEELNKLLELKENLGDDLPPQYTDAELLGFIRARSLNVKEAEKLMKLDVSSKKLLRIDHHINNFPTELLPYSYGGVIGFDKERSLVKIVNIGHCDVKGFTHTVSTIDQLRLLICMVERDLRKMQEESKKTGKKHSKCVYILNFENFSFSDLSYKPGVDSGMIFLKLLQEHYHDVVKLIYVINAPSFISTVYKIFKPVIQDSLQEKIKILESDNWKEELLKQIDADVLPKYFGGTRVDSNGDPKCSEFVKYGEKIPESLYSTNFLNPDDPDVVAATVPAGLTLNFRYPVRKAGTVIRWHLQSKDNDIGVALYMEPFQEGYETPRTQMKKRKEEDMSKFEQLTPIIRSQCHLCPELGSAIMWRTGNIILHFDNTYSWMNSKEVYFKFAMRPPTNAEMNEVNMTGQVVKGIGKILLAN